MGLKLAFIGSINDEIIDKEELAAELLKFLIKHYGRNLNERYGIETEDPYEALREVAQARSCLLKGNELDTKKAANLLLDDFRSGKLGRITLEFPEAPGEK